MPLSVDEFFCMYLGNMNLEQVAKRDERGDTLRMGGASSIRTNFVKKEEGLRHATE
jgi:hypothetical protein